MNGEALAASEEELRAFTSAPPGQRKLTPALRGVLAEIATAGVLRYPWPLVCTLMGEIMDQVLQEFEAEAHVEVMMAMLVSALHGNENKVGPSPAGMGPEAAAETRKRLGSLLEGCTRGPPFTVQRFSELLLAPSKQYSSFVKLALALEKQLVVVSVLPQTPAPPDRPRLANLPPINENPPPPDTAATSAAPAAQPPAANGPLANGGDDAARAVAAGAGGGFSSSMHAAAETAFLNSVFTESGPTPDAAQGNQQPVTSAPGATAPVKPSQSSAAAPTLPSVGSAATAAAPEAAAVMPAALVAQEAVTDGASPQLAAASTADNPTADDPALEALLQAPAAEPMDVDLVTPAVDTGAAVSAEPGDAMQADVAAAAAPA